MVRVCGVKHKDRVGLAFVVDHQLFWRGLGRGTGQLVFLERVGLFRVVSLGNSVHGSLCAGVCGVIGRVSVADASLSLSLSLVESAKRR